MNIVENKVLEDLMPIRHYVPLYHGTSEIHGIGLFTPVDINEDQIIGVSHAFYEGYWYMTTHGNYNHSENPNCRIEVEGNITTMVAERKIIHGEELTVDYREQQYLEQPKEDWVK
tara:strand:+ start:59 stop:403 length:345 start_codon:yes stop_codon:yes gene_type:complete